MNRSWMFLGNWVLVPLGLSAGVLSAQDPAPSVPGHSARPGAVSSILLPTPSDRPVEAPPPSPLPSPQEANRVQWSILGALVGAPVGAGLGYAAARASRDNCRRVDRRNAWEEWCIDERLAAKVGAVVGFFLGGYLYARHVAGRERRFIIHSLSVAPVSTAPGRLALGVSISASNRR